MSIVQEQENNNSLADLYSKSNDRLTKIVRVSFLVEQLISYLSRTSFGQVFNQQRFLEILSLLEMIKIYYKSKKFIALRNSIYLSEDNLQKDEDVREDVKSAAFERFFTEDYMRKYANSSEEELEKLMRESLDRIKVRGSNNSLIFNIEYKEVFARVGKSLGMLQKLPVAGRISSYEELNKNSSSSTAVKLGERLFMIRPVIYAVLLRIFGTVSYLPYLVSLFIDGLRMILQRRVKFRNAAQRDEFRQRN